MSELVQWRGINVVAHVTKVDGNLYRVVESQEQIATVGLVDTLDEQSLLEQLLERSKPAARSGSNHLHYLLMSPFRYPPLQHGSRFGGRHEPSIFYGSHASSTARAEAAYYRFVLWAGMATPPRRPVRSEHTLYRVRYQTDWGLKLQAEPFAPQKRILTSPTAYTETQALGTAMRAAGVLAFEFVSARDVNAGINVGLYTPEVFASGEVTNLQQWLCEVDGKVTRFLSLSAHVVEHYPLEQFLVEGQLPAPAV